MLIFVLKKHFLLLSTVVLPNIFVETVTRLFSGFLEYKFQKNSIYLK